MRYGRAISVAGLMAGLMGIAPGVGLLEVTPMMAQTVEQRKAEADRIFQQGIQQYRISQFEAALQFWQQALQIYRDLNPLRSH